MSNRIATWKAVGVIPIPATVHRVRLKGVRARKYESTKEQRRHVDQ